MGWAGRPPDSRRDAGATVQFQAMRTLRFGFIVFLFSLTAFAQDGQQQFVSLGDFKLESGETIRDCRLGYRTFGQLNSDKSNAILFPTWFTGTTAQLVELVGPGKLVDSSKYYVILVDALGDGISTSPSNSLTQPRMKFPKLAIRDMVNSQRQMLTEKFHINHLKAVVGISMGGMQTFQWIVSYPDFMDKAVPIVGSPLLAPFDLVLWQTENDAIMGDPIWKNGEYTEQPGLAVLAGLEGLALQTPEKFNQDTTRDKLPAWFAETKKSVAEFDANNHIRQSQAMMAHDVSATFGGSMDRAAAAVKAKVLVVVSLSDHIVTPVPALNFAALLHAETLELKDNCGHSAVECETGKIGAAIAAFLDK
jgi:homoserine O-acetyltransferase/O-succinyltransferase